MALRNTSPTSAVRLPSVRQAPCISGETFRDRSSYCRAARSSSPSVSTRARQRANTMGTWSTRTVCTCSTRNASASAYASGRSFARSTSSRTFANPRSPDRNAFSVTGIARSPHATRISPDTAPRACSVRAATHPGPDWAPSAAHATRASHTPSSATRPAASRFHAASSSTSNSDRAASGSSPGQSDPSASAKNRAVARTYATPEPPQGGSSAKWWPSIMCSSLATATDQ